MVNIPPSSGVNLKYLLQKYSDERRIGQTEPIYKPNAIPVLLHVDE